MNRKKGALNIPSCQKFDAYILGCIKLWCLFSATDQWTFYVVIKRQGEKTSFTPIPTGRECPNEIFPLYIIRGPHAVDSGEIDKRVRNLYR
jgi:hypothetical protein